MLSDYTYLGLFLLVAILFTINLLLVPITLRFLGIIPRKPNPVKTAPYECGMETVGRTWIQFNFRYYFYAILFVAFDVLTVFLYPWAVSLGVIAKAGVAMGAAVILIFVTVVGYIYAWKKGVMEWK